MYRAHNNFGAVYGQLKNGGAYVLVIFFILQLFFLPFQPLGLGLMLLIASMLLPEDYRKRITGRYVHHIDNSL